MSGVNCGGSASRSTGGTRSNTASSIVIDLTEDSDTDSNRSENPLDKPREKPQERSKERPKERPKENPKEHSTKAFINLDSSSEDEPINTPVSVKPQGKAKLAKPTAIVPGIPAEKSSGKAPMYENGGTYCLFSEGESDDEPPPKLSESRLKQSGGNSRINTISRRSPSKSTMDDREMASRLAPPIQGTARKSALQHRKSSSGPIGPFNSNLTQNKKNSAPTSARSTPGASKSHANLSISGSNSTLCHVMDQQSISKATGSTASDISQLNPASVKDDRSRMPHLAKTPVSLPTNGSFMRKESAPHSSFAQHEFERVATPRLQRPSSPKIKESPLSTKRDPSIISRSHAQVNDNRLEDEKGPKIRAELDSRKERNLLRESQIEREVGYSMEDKNSNSSTSKKIPRITREVLERRAEGGKSQTESDQNSNNEQRTENENEAGNREGNRELPRRILQPDGNGSSDNSKKEAINDKSLSGSDKVRKAPYKKKGNHGGARRGPAWEEQMNQKHSTMRGKNADDRVVDEDDDDIRQETQRKRKRGQASNELSMPLTTCSALAFHQKSEEESRGRWEGRIDPVSKGKSSTLSESSSMVRQKLLIDKVKAAVTVLEETMMEDRGLSVRTLLEKRQLRHQSALNQDSLDDDESPFTSLQAPKKLTEEVTKLNIRTTTKIKTPNYIVPKAVGDGAVERTPSYIHHTNVKRNHLTGDDDKLRYIPMFANNNEAQSEAQQKRLERDLHTAYSERNDDPREKEQISEINRQIDNYLKEFEQSYDGCNREALIRYFLGNRSSTLEEYSTSEKQFVLKTLGGPLSDDLYETMEIAAEELAKHLVIDLTDVVLSPLRFKKLVEESRAKLFERSGDQPAAPERLDTMFQFSCLFCHGAACTTHGEYYSRKINRDIPCDSSIENDSPERSPAYEYVWEKSIMHCSDVMRKHNARDHSQRDKNWHPEDWNTDKDTKEPCRNECYRRRTEWTNYTWTQEEEKELARKLSFVKPDRPCSLAGVVDKPCYQIYSKILELDEKTTPISKIQSPPEHQESEQAIWYNPKAVPRNRGLKPGWQDATRAHMHDYRAQSVPCTHDGPCSREMNCHCVINNLLCEQFCGCPDDCARRFAGCSCREEGLSCLSDSCICFQMHRECGDKCDTCGAIPRIKPQSRYDETLFEKGCQNIALQRGVNKKLILGKSQLEGVGFGLFTAEPVKKGDFLSEYTGEVISYNEAERRGVGYDAKYSSFLFDLNKEWIIDAARMGNKTRYINHAETEADGVNCTAKILLANGEHRIEFRASRDIKIGEEVFFNYGKKFAEVHGLNKKIGDRKGKTLKTNKGVVTGEAALAELDGWVGHRGDRVRMRKEQEKAEEAVKQGGTKRRPGWKKGRPRGKASKKAEKDPGYGVAGPSNTHSDQEEENDHGDGDEMMDVDQPLYPNVIEDSDVEDEIFAGKSSDIEMGDGDDEEEEEEDEDEDPVRRTRRTRKLPQRYTR